MEANQRSNRYPPVHEAAFLWVLGSTSGEGLAAKIQHRLASSPGDAVITRQSRNRTLELGLLLVGLTAVVTGAIAVPRAGIGWDSGMHTYGALDTRGVNPARNLEDAYDQVYANLEFYGVLIQWLSDGVGSLLGNPTPLQPDQILTYQIQAGVTFGLSVLSAAVVSVVIAHLLDSRLLGVFLWSSMVSLPFLMGHSVLNPKDMPTTSGMLLMSAGLASIWKFTKARGSLAGVGLVAAGSFLVLGTRIGSWPLLAVVVLLNAIVISVVSLNARNARIFLVQNVVPLSGIALGIMGVYLVNPIARVDLTEWMLDSFRVSRSIPWEGTIRTLGQDVVSVDLPWWYIPSWLVAQTPVLMLILFVFGTLYWLSKAATELVNSLRTHIGTTRCRELPLVPFAIQALVLPGGMVLLGATLYDGVRHVAFMVPALMVLSLPLIARLLQVAKDKKSRLRSLPVLVGVLILAIPLSSLIGSLRWFPYMYAFVNPITASLDDGRDWEYDYWGATIVEGTNRLRELGATQVVVSPPIDWTGSSEVLSIRQPGEVAGDDEYGLYVFNRWYAKVPDEGCREVFEISRGGIVLGKGAICQGDSSLQELGRNVRVPENE